jgi:hypothetical protein
MEDDTGAAALWATAARCLFRELEVTRSRMSASPQKRTSVRTFRSPLIGPNEFDRGLSADENFSRRLTSSIAPPTLAVLFGRRQHVRRSCSSSVLFESFTAFGSEE